MKQKMGTKQGVAAQVVKTPLMADKCTENIRKAVAELSAMPNVFAKIVQDANEQNLPSATLVIGMCNDTVGVLPGQYVAQIHLVVHRMPDDKELNDNIPLPGQPIVQTGGEGA